MCSIFGTSSAIFLQTEDALSWLWGNAQVWPLKIVPFMKGYMTLLLVPYVWVPTAALILAWPWWPGTVIAVSYVLLWLPTRILLSRDFEWLTVWCWTSAPSLLFN